MGCRGTAASYVAHFAGALKITNSEWESVLLGGVESHRADFIILLKN